MPVSPTAYTHSKHHSPIKLESFSSSEEEDVTSSSSSGSDSDGSVESKKPPDVLPIMNIQRLRFYPKTLKSVEKTGLSPLEILALAIEQIIAEYRIKHRSEIHKLKVADQLPKTVGLYNLQIYYWKTENCEPIHSFLKSIGAGRQILAQSKKIHNYFLFFFYRVIPKSSIKESSREVFVTTTGHAWQIPRHFVDYSFPSAVAKRVLKPSLNQKQSQYLSGGTDTSIDHYRVAKEVYEDPGTYALVTNFSAVMKTHSSLRALPPFNPPGKKVSPKNIAVRIGLGSMKISKKLSLEELALVLEHLSKIARNEPTFSKNKEQIVKEEDDPKFRFLSRIQPVLGSEVKKLDNLLKKELWKLLQNRAPTSTLWVGHKFSRDYRGASEFKFYPKPAKKEAEYSWYHPPSISDVLDRFRSRKRSKSEKRFFKALETCQIAYPRKRQKVIRASTFPHFFAGEIRTEKGTSFKIQGIWRRAAYRLQELVDRDFHRLLDSALVVEEKEQNIYGLIKTWVPEKKWTQLSKKELANVTNLKGKKLEAFIKLLKEQNYSFIDEDGQALFHNLFGPALTTIPKKHHDKINQLLEEKKSISIEDLKKALKTSQKKAKEIYEDLKKDRPCLENTSSNSHYQVRVSPKIPKKRAKLEEKLKQLFSAKVQATEYVIQDEGAYNESYLDVPSYLPGDRICPYGVEPWDLLRYTKEHLVFYHVKESFGQKTRDACSQIVVAARTLDAALKNLARKDNVLHEWWNKAINYTTKGAISGYRKGLKERLLRLAPKGTSKKQVHKAAKRAFLDLFHSGKTLTFVYAFLDTAVQERSLEEEYKRHHFDVHFFKEKFTFSDEKAADILQQLTRGGYLLGDGYITEKFLEAESFPRTLKIPKKQTILKKMKEKIGFSQFRTTIAKIELLRTKAQLSKMGFQFKIVQIKRPKGAKGHFLGKAPYTPLPSTPDTDPIADIINKSHFLIEGKLYSRKFTKGGGSCAIHAFYGEYNGNEYAYKTAEQDVDLAAKKDFVDKLQKGLKGPQRYILRDIIYNCLDELIGRIRSKNEIPNCKQLLPESIREEALKKHTELNRQLLSLEKKEHALWKNYVDDSKIKDALAKVIVENYQGGKDLVKKPADFIAALTNLRSDAFAALFTNIPKWDAIKKIKQHKKKLKKDFVKGYEKRYLEVLKTQEYWYLDFELKIMAILENKTLYVFKESEPDTPHIFNKQATPSDPIVIEQTGDAPGAQHYNRCMPIKPKSSHGKESI